MRVLIVEDEKLLAEELEEQLITIDKRIVVTGKLGSVQEAVEWFKSNCCDLLFLDIHLNDGLSFSIFEKVDVSCPVIFTTAYDEYAIKAFDVNSIAYLLKPIDNDDLQKALQKYDNLHLQQNSLQKLLNYINEKDKSYLKRITLKLGKIEKPLEVDKVAYFMAEDRFVFAVTKEGKRYFYEEALYELEKKLNSKDFFRVNRTFIINYKSVDEVIAYTKGRVLLKLKPKPTQEVVVSSEKAKDLRRWLNL